LWGRTRKFVRSDADVGVANCPLRFQGQYEDAESGLYYNLNRYYDPLCGMYLSPDPIGLAGGIHPNAYVHNPTAWIDPLGLAGCLLYGSSEKVAANAKWHTVSQTYEGNPGIRNHFHKHGSDMGFTSSRAYDQGARNTIRNADHVFSYTDKFTNESRVGYFNSKNGDFVATTQNGGVPTINTFFNPRKSWKDFKKEFINYSNIKK